MIDENNIAVKRELAKILNILRDTYPHVAEKISELWSGPELNMYIKHLYLNTRDDGTKRRGFEFDIIRCLMDVHELHNAMYDFSSTQDPIDVFAVKNFTFQAQTL